MALEPSLEVKIVAVQAQHRQAAVVRALDLSRSYFFAISRSVNIKSSTYGLLGSTVRWRSTQV